MKIIKKEILCDTGDTRVSRLVIHSPDIAARAWPGQFVILMVSEQGERIPLTVVDKNEENGSITLIAQELGFTTRLLSRMKEGNRLYSLVGPLGHATVIKNYGRVILVGGGVGIAEIYPVAKALKEAGNYVVTIIGARTKKLLILEDELKEVSDELHIATDDGSYGKKGFTTDILKEILDAKRTTQNAQRIFTVGPIPMMSKVCSVSAPYKIKTLVSLNSLMVDGSGMCGSCRVTVDGKTKFTCVDGPEFDGHLVDWEELGKRSKIYEKQEKHICENQKN